MHALAYVRRPRATLAILFSKIDFFLFKRLYFYSSQFNILLGLKLALLPLDLEFKHHWGMGARVIRSTKCGVYRCQNQRLIPQKNLKNFMASLLKNWVVLIKKYKKWKPNEKLSINVNTLIGGAYIFISTGEIGYLTLCYLCMS